MPQLLDSTMQADSVNVHCLLRWLTETKGLDVQEEWLRACVEWLLTEETVDSDDSLRALVYEQWLHADLRDIVSRGCIPDSVTRQQKGQVRGQFIVQVQSVVDVSKPAYGQLQKLKGRSLDEADTPEKKYPEPKASRLLLLELTDGVSSLKAMEYQPLSQLNQRQLLPGTKLLIEGELEHRLGVLLLKEGQVQVLGGSVEHLLESNSTRKMLARLLNDESLADAEPSRGQPEVATDLQPIHAAPAAGNGTITVSPLPSHSSMGQTRNCGVSVNADSTMTSRAGMSAPAATQSVVSEQRNAPPSQRRTSAEVDDEISQFIAGGVDFDNFEDFDEDDCSDPAENMEQELVDVPGHEEWPEDDPINYSPVEESRDVGFADNNRISSNTAGSSSSKEVVALYSETSNLHFYSRVKPVALKSTLSLRQQKSGKTRICEIERSGDSKRKETRQIAMVKPIIQQEQPTPAAADREKQPPSLLLTEMELSEEPVAVSTVAEVERNSWKLHPFLKIKACLVRVCEMLDHKSGLWRVTVMVADEQGTQIKVQLSDKVLEMLIGFSAVEFRDYINPNKHIPEIKVRGAKGFARCTSALEDLTCFMVLTKPTLSHYPCVIQLLDL